MRGYTLLETIIAIVVIGIISLGLMAVFTSTFIHATRDEIITTATMLAESQIERVIGLPFLNVNDEHRDSPISFGGEFSNYYWQVRVDPVPLSIASDEGMNNYKQIEVRVTNSIIGDINLKTIITNR